MLVDCFVEMNLLQLSETLNDGEREWTSMIHTGVHDNSLLKLTADSLPPKCSTEIDKLITELNEKIHQRDTILTKVGIMHPFVDCVQFY